MQNEDKSVLIESKFLLAKCVSLLLLSFFIIIIRHKIIHIVELHTERKRKNRSALCDTNKGHGNKSYSESFFKVGGKLQELSGLRGK